MNKLDKFLFKVDKKTRLIIEKVILLIIAGNLSLLDVKKLKGSQEKFRVRVGKVRIIFEHTENGNKIKDVSYRNDNTYSSS